MPLELGIHPKKASKKMTGRSMKNRKTRTPPKNERSNSSFKEKANKAANENEKLERLSLSKKQGGGTAKKKDRM